MLATVFLVSRTLLGPEGGCKVVANKPSVNSLVAIYIFLHKYWDKNNTNEQKKTLDNLLCTF